MLIEKERLFLIHVPSIKEGIVLLEIERPFDEILKTLTVDCKRFCF